MLSFMYTENKTLSNMKKKEMYYQEKNIYFKSPSSNILHKMKYWQLSPWDLKQDQYVHY